MFRIREGRLEVLIAHPGGPLWAKKDKGAWSIIKGELTADENALDGAKREFFEETGLATKEPFYSLGEIVQKSGKKVIAWAFEGDCDPTRLKSNTFQLEWPPKSGRISDFPEIDRFEFCTIATARERLNPAQVQLIERLVTVRPEAFGLSQVSAGAPPDELPLFS